MEGNIETLNKRLSEIGALKIKLLVVKRCNRLYIALKGYFTQILLKLKSKESWLSLLRDAVVYAGMFLLGRVLEWFKPYLTKY